MNNRIPYYMMYSDIEEFAENRYDRQDLAYMQGLYPKVAKQVLPYIEEECERLSYEGSLIYDEFPDKLLLRLMCNRIYRKFKKEYECNEYFIDERDEVWYRELIEIMVYHELHKRRHKWRKCRKIWY